MASILVFISRFARFASLAHLQLLTNAPALRLRYVCVRDEAQDVDGVAVERYVDLVQIRPLHAVRLDVKRSEARGDVFQRIWNARTGELVFVELV